MVSMRDTEAQGPDSDWLSVLIEQACPEEPSYVNDPDKWANFGGDCGLDAVGANFEDDGLPAEELQLPPDEQAGLVGLDLPSLDDLLWQDAVCNDFGVQPSSSASAHQPGPCQRAGCADCAQSAHAGQQASSGAAASAIPLNDSPAAEKAPPKLPPLQQQQQDGQPALASSPEHALQTPPQTDRALKPAAEPASSRDSNPANISPASSCDLPEHAHKRRRAAESSPERSGPASSSEGKSARTAVAAPPQQDGQQGQRAGSPSSEEESEERKRQARMQRNRESAQQSRQRKKMQMDELERRANELQAHNIHLSGMVAALAAENAVLRHQLALAQGQAPQPHSAAPLPLLQQQQQQGAAAHPMPMPGAGGLLPPGVPPPMPYMGWMPGMPYFGPTPKLPIQRLKRDEPPKKAQPAAATSGKGGAAGPASKRARVAAGSTALLALFSFLVFMGPLPYWPGSSAPGSAPVRLGGAGTPYAALPATVHAGGRVLQSVDADWSSQGNITTGSMLAPAAGAAAGAPNASSSGAWPPPGRNETAWQHGGGDVLAAHPGDAKAKASALQRLKDLAPITLYSDWGDQGGVASAWQRMPLGAGPGRSPLLPPMQCREVFSLDASPDIDAASARRQLQAYLSNLSSFRGRALQGPLAMPPVSRSLPASGDEEAKSGGFKAKIGGEEGEDEVVVSIMLPAQQGAASDNKSFTSLDEIFVVVVKPLKRYATYACSLNTPILV